MDSKNRIEIVLSQLEIKAPTLAKNIGVKYQRIYDIQKGKTKDISGEVANAIVSKYPQFNINWILGSDSEMLKSKDTPTNKGNIEVSKEAWELINLQAKTLDRQAQSLDKRDRQIDELISLLTIQISDNKKTATAAGA